MAAATAPKEQTFFAKEATRVANVFNNPDLLDATFKVGERAETEEILALSQFKATLRPLFKELF